MPRNLRYTTVCSVYAATVREPLYHIAAWWMYCAVTLFCYALLTVWPGGAVRLCCRVVVVVRVVQVAVERGSSLASPPLTPVLSGGPPWSLGAPLIHKWHDMTCSCHHHHRSLSTTYLLDRVVVVDCSDMYWIVMIATTCMLWRVFLMYLLIQLFTAILV